MALIPAHANVLRFRPPAEDAALEASPKAGGHLQAPMGVYAVKALLVAVLHATGGEALPNPVAGLHRTVAAHKVISLPMVDPPQLLRDRHPKSLKAIEF
jgi:hypothetical protein